MPTRKHSFDPGLVHPEGRYSHPKRQAHRYWLVLYLCMFETGAFVLYGEHGGRSPCWYILYRHTAGIRKLLRPVSLKIMGCATPLSPAMSTNYIQYLAHIQYSTYQDRALVYVDLHLCFSYMWHGSFLFLCCHHSMYGSSNNPTLICGLWSNKPSHE